MVGHCGVCEVDCFAALAMTVWRLQRLGGARKDALLSCEARSDVAVHG